MSLKKTFITLGFVTIMLAGCSANAPTTEIISQSQKGILVHQPDFNGVIMPEESYPGLYKYQGLEFQPSEQEVINAEKILPECFQQNTKDERTPQVLEKLNTYTRQYFGNIDHDTEEKSIIIDAVSEKQLSVHPNWQEKSVMTTYGGDNYFHAEMNLSQGKCTKFYINPEEK